VSNVFAKKLAKNNFWSQGNKNSSASSPVQATYTIKISGCCQKIKITKWQASFYCFGKKLAKKVSV
jgi:hypothetical protein